MRLVEHRDIAIILSTKYVYFKECPSGHTRSTRRHIPEDGILHSHRRENLKSYMFILNIYNKTQYTYLLGLTIRSSMQGIPTKPSKLPTQSC
jgi:hypothetical protein